jgi:hypothetical protein
MVAENDDKNEAVMALVHLFGATGYPDDRVANEGVVPMTPAAA